MSCLRVFRQLSVLLPYIFLKKDKVMKKVISTAKAPSAIGPYSQAIDVNGFVYTSGQIPINPATGNIVEGGIKE